MSVIKPYQFLSKEKIEHLANDLLMRMQGTPNFPKWPGVADRAVNFLKLGMDSVKIPDQNGRPVAARIYPTQRLIQINEDIPKLQQDRGFEASTIAHEVGHWVLHINQDEADGIVEQLELSLDCATTEQPFLCRDVGERIALSSPKTQADWIEWQAQYFASCLLMPRYKLEEARRGRDLTNWNHLYAMRDELGVTISNLTNRLQDLGWIDIPKGSKQIYLRNTGFNR
ncbi:MAG: ImmA/IrrE family metallo-endopeptidase [Microcoleus vaginatus WJT46-NPBG5]|nr:ImmA/IrrE family metallo-endopeptidase [Microcoleus vaginatus WJT46-NPBG5]